MFRGGGGYIVSRKSHVGRLKGNGLGKGGPLGNKVARP